MVIIDAGRVIAQGTPDELKDAIGTRIDVVLADAGDLAAAAGRAGPLGDRPARH